METTAKRKIQLVKDAPVLIQSIHRILVIWGSTSHHRRNPDDPICEYRFNTKAELDAFRLGMDDAVGYHEYSVVDDDGEEIF
jgi:hypothetical protein